MEEQRTIFNVKLLERDAAISQLRSRCADLEEQLSAKALAVKQLAKRKAKAEDNKVDADAQTEGGFKVGNASESAQSTQTGDVRGNLWRVARRRLAIKALSALDKKNKASAPPPPCLSPLPPCACSSSAR